MEDSSLFVILSLIVSYIFLFIFFCVRWRYFGYG